MQSKPWNKLIQAIISFMKMFTSGEDFIKLVLFSKDCVFHDEFRIAEADDEYKLPFELGGQNGINGANGSSQ